MPNVVYFTAIVAPPGCRITGGVVSAVSGTWKEASGAVKAIGTGCRYGDITQLLNVVGDLHLHNTVIVLVFIIIYVFYIL